MADPAGQAIVDNEIAREITVLQAEAAMDPNNANLYNFTAGFLQNYTKVNLDAELGGGGSGGRAEFPRP